MNDCLQKLSSAAPFFWLNPEYGKSTEKLPCGMADILDAEARLMRFAPLLAELFDEAAEGYGVIEEGETSVDTAALTGESTLTGRLLGCVTKSSPATRRGGCIWWQAWYNRYYQAL